MKAIILAAFCVVWAHQSHQHHEEGHFLAYKFGLYLQDDSLLHKRQVGLHNASKMAEVVLLSAGEQKDVGKIVFHYDGKVTMVSGHVKGLTPGKHGFHIHEKGDISNKCVGAGGHFNPENKHHGAPTDEDRHVGDLGNIEAGTDGIAKVNILDKIIALEGPHNIINRAVVVHADPDDLGKGGQEDSLTTGHAGARVACGVIRVVEHRH